MAYTASLPAFADAPRGKSAVPAFARRVINAIVASRVEAARAELRRHDFLLRETALTHGEYRAIGLDKADLLPFNA